MAVAVMAKLIRLDKYLVEMNKGSRTQIKDAAKKGRIQVNGVPEKKTERKIDPETDEVTFDSQPVSYRAMEYIMLYKPQGVISATEDKRHKTVIDLLSGENRSDLFPVGRLDIDTEGLLLLTNDGDLTIAGNGSGADGSRTDINGWYPGYAWKTGDFKAME